MGRSGQGEAITKALVLAREYPFNQIRVVEMPGADKSRGVMAPWRLVTALGNLVFYEPGLESCTPGEKTGEK